MEKEYKRGILFAGIAVSESEKARVIEELEEVGPLTFTMHYSEEGWTATCDQIPSIIAGNTNPKPNDIEIQSEIRSAIFAALDVQFQKPEVESPYTNSFAYSVAE
ncbi:MAG TPA: hypothetical protein VHC68_00730 [Candidatus Paceibacterota bacterium]|nr:hypothetical protein [Candidatus Paceibacterota bacterium]